MIADLRLRISECGPLRDFSPRWATWLGHPARSLTTFGRDARAT